MARPKYTLTKNDYTSAHKYIDNKLRHLFWLDDGDMKTEKDIFQATEEFKKISYKASNRADLLNAWCEKWLDAGRWQQLKNAIKSYRRRKSGTRIARVDLTREAWRVLKTLAEHEKITMSEVINGYLGEHYLKALIAEDSETLENTTR